jgi:hypothetical protein
MPLEVGQTLWLPCEVKPGPFPDERMVRIETDRGGQWVGFVPVWLLKEPVEKGRTHVKAVVAEVREDTFSAKLPGHFVTSGMIEGQSSRVERIGPV